MRVAGLTPATKVSAIPYLSFLLLEHLTHLVSTLYSLRLSCANRASSTAHLSDDSALRLFFFLQISDLSILVLSHNVSNRW